MTARRRKKNTRQRGNWTHGWGSKKKHRGAGNRGGRGKAGTGKRGDAKKPSIWHNKKYFGGFGFFRHSAKEKTNAINLSSLQERLNTLVKQELVSKKGDKYEVDLGKLGYNKLLGKGKVKCALIIKTPYASHKAIASVKDAGGDVVGLLKEKMEKSSGVEEPKKDAKSE